MWVILDRNEITSRCDYFFTSAPETAAWILYDAGREAVLSSVGSDDATLEYYEITFPGERDLTTVIIDNTNIAVWELWQDGATKVGGGTNIASTIVCTFNKAVTTLQLIAYTTQTPNQQKRIGRMYAGKVFHQFASYPVAASFNRTGIQSINAVASGGSVVTNFNTETEINLSWDNATAADVDALISLRDNLTTRFFWPGAGSGMTDWGYRDHDFWPVGVSGPVSPALRNGIPGAGSQLDVTLVSLA